MRWCRLGFRTTGEKLNQATRKDHFPLSFIDQVLEKLVGKSHFCFTSTLGSLMTIAKYSSIAIPRIYAIATSLVGMD
ncbi:hypothetical protein CR513_30528, partial [Mucuna pruriens]